MTNICKNLLPLDFSQNGAEILTRAKVISAERKKKFWTITVKDTRSFEEKVFKSKVDLIVSNRNVDDLHDVQQKVFTRDLYGVD